MRRGLVGVLIVLPGILGCARQQAVPRAAVQAPAAAAPAGVPDDREPGRRPDSAFSRRVHRANLEEYAKVVAEGEWWRKDGWRSNQDDVHINDIKIVSTKTLDKTVVPGKTVRLIVAHVEASFWRLDADIVMALEPQYTDEERREDLFAYSPLLVCHAEKASCRVVNLGTRQPRYALMVQDNWEVNGASGTQTRIYVYRAPDLGYDGLFEVFGDVTEHWHDPWEKSPTWTQSRVSFRESRRALKDIAVTTHVERWNGKDPDAPDYRKVLDEERTSVFRWNGERYVGRMNVHG